MSGRHKSETTEPDSTGISFTAFYTGEVWQRHGLSVPFLRSRRGRVLYDAGRPLEWVARHTLGTSNETLLLQRHSMIDHLLHRAIQDRGVRQVVEIACGLSPRGTRISREFEDLGLVYVEADLPRMAGRKRSLLREAGELSERHQVQDCDILEQQGDTSLEALLKRLDPQKETVVITEGLVNYFDYPTIRGFWERLAAGLRGFPKGIYLTEIYPDLPHHVATRVAKLSLLFLAFATKSRVTLHFGSEAEIEQKLTLAGFASTRVHLPEEYYGKLDIPVQRIPSMIRVVECCAG